MITKLFTQIKKHKFTASLAFLLIIGIGYWGFGSLFSQDGVVRYASAQVQKGTLIVSLLGSGQVSATNQLDVKPKASGDVVYVGVKNGQEVKTGTLIAQLDVRDAQKSVRDAETNLESAKISLEKLKKPADTLSLLQAENALTQAKRDLADLLKPPDALALLQAENALEQAQQSKQKAEDDLEKAYDDGFNTIANSFLDLPGVMAGLEDTFFDNTIDPDSWSGNNITWYVNQTDYQTGTRDKAIHYQDDVYNAYNTARAAYTKSFDNYKTASRTSDKQTIEALISETYKTTKIIADAIKTSNNYIDFVQDDMEKHNRNIPAMVSTHQSNLDSYTAKTNSHLLSLLGIKTTIQTSKDAIVNADRSIAEKTESLDKLKNGPEANAIKSAEEKISDKEKSLAKLKAGTDALDIQSTELTIKQRENALLDAKEKLADYYVRALFDGVIAKTDVKKGDPVTSTSVLATLITRQKLAEVSLNEVDVTQIKVGQKATLTFDAILDLTITGQVVEIDTVGTASQGVVTYNMKIAFDTQDERVKPAMSVSAAIVTEAKPNVLLVPNSAVKSQGGLSYVEIVDGDDKNIALTANVSGIILKNSPQRQNVEIGAASDEFTEVVSGINAGDVIVTRTIQPTAAQTTQTQQQSGGLRIPGLNTGGGGTRTGGGFQR